MYNQEFWDLWRQIGIGGLRHFEEIYNNGKYYIKPITTAGFLDIETDDLIYFWHEKVKFKFSNQLFLWIKCLKLQFNIVLEDEEIYLKAFKEEPLRHIVDIMEAAEENYYHILTFTEFFEETKDNIEDKRYWALWKVYEDKVYNPEFIKKEVLFLHLRGQRIREMDFGRIKENPKEY